MAPDAFNPLACGVKSPVDADTNNGLVITEAKSGVPADACQAAKVVLADPKKPTLLAVPPAPVKSKELLLEFGTAVDVAQYWAYFTPVFAWLMVKTLFLTSKSNGAPLK